MAVSKEGFVMRKTVLFSLAIACAFLVSSAHESVSSVGNEPIRLMRRPDINNGRIVFTWAGDLWMVSEEGGLARRITVHEGTEDNAKFSPDGKWIAFSGDINARSEQRLRDSRRGNGRAVAAHLPRRGRQPRLLDARREERHLLLDAGIVRSLLQEVLPRAGSGRAPRRVPDRQGELRELLPGRLEARLQPQLRFVLVVEALQGERESGCLDLRFQSGHLHEAHDLGGQRRLADVDGRPDLFRLRPHG